MWLGGKWSIMNNTLLPTYWNLKCQASNWAPQSSNRGMVRHFRGATLVLEATREMCMFPSLSIMRRQLQHMHFLKHRWLSQCDLDVLWEVATRYMFLRDFNWERQSRHSSAIGWGTGSSQPIWLPNSLEKNLDLDYGQSIPAKNIICLCNVWNQCTLG